MRQFVSCRPSCSSKARQQVHSTATHAGSNNKTFLSPLQVALKLLLCWQGVVVNSQDVVKPYIHGLLPPVVSVLLPSNKGQAPGRSASLHSFTTFVLPTD